VSEVMPFGRSGSVAEAAITETAFAPDWCHSSGYSPAGTGCSYCRLPNVDTTDAVLDEYATAGLVNAATTRHRYERSRNCGCSVHNGPLHPLENRESRLWDCSSPLPAQKQGRLGVRARSLELGWRAKPARVAEPFEIWQPLPKERACHRIASRVTSPAERLHSNEQAGNNPSRLDLRRYARLADHWSPTHLSAAAPPHRTGRRVLDR